MPIREAEVQCVMRDSQTRSFFSHACAGKSISKEDYSGHLIKKCIEDVDSAQKDVHLKTDQEPALTQLQERVRILFCAPGGETILENGTIGECQSNGTMRKSCRSQREELRLSWQRWSTA